MTARRTLLATLCCVQERRQGKLRIESRLGEFKHVREKDKIPHKHMLNHGLDMVHKRKARLERRYHCAV